MPKLGRNMPCGGRLGVSNDQFSPFSYVRSTQENLNISNFFMKYLIKYLDGILFCLRNFC